MITVTGPAPGTLVAPSKATLPGGEGAVAEVPFARQSRLDRLKTSGKYDATDDDDQEWGGIDDRGEGDEDDIAQDGRQKKFLKAVVEKKMRGKNKSMKR